VVSGVEWISRKAQAGAGDAVASNVGKSLGNGVMDWYCRGLGRITWTS